MERLARNVDLASDVVDGLIGEVETFRRQFDILQTNLHSMQEHLQSKKNIIDGNGRGLRPNPDDMEVLLMLGAIPHQADVDHA